MTMVMNGKHDSSKRFKGHNSSHNAHLPDEIIIYNILTRISYVDLYRFRCVCKLWSNLIRDPLFKSLYSQYTPSSRGFISLESDHCIGREKETTTYHFVFFDFDKKEKQLIPFRLPPERDFGCFKRDPSIHIEHSIDGMLLISFGYKKFEKYFVYNLVTASWLYMGISAEKWRKSYFDAFLAYDPIISKYKVVIYSDDRKFRILSDMRWSYVSIPNHIKEDFGIHASNRPVFINHCLHCICRPGVYASSNKLLRLDASKEKVSTIKLPVKALHSDSPDNDGLLKMGELLWYFQSTSNRVKFWYLKKKKGNRGFEDNEWVVMWNINLMAEISLQQLKSSTSVSVKSRSSPVLLKNCHWSIPNLLVMDPNCEFVFTYYEDRHTYVCSYDVELNQGNLIYETKTENQYLQYWHGNNIALSTQ